jgi:hypothetical protein
MAHQLEGYAAQAQQKGWLVHEADQMDMPPSRTGDHGPWGDVKAGMCAGLAMRWIELRYAGRDFPYDPHRLRYDRTDVHAMAAQNIMQNWSAERRRAGTGIGALDRPEMLAQHFRMSASPGLRRDFFGGFDKADLIAVVAKAYGCYFVDLTTQSGGQAHAIAVEHARDNRFHLFDPNWGHFAARQVGGFAEFLAWFLRASDYDSLYYRQSVVGIRPGH